MPPHDAAFPHLRHQALQHRPVKSMGRLHRCLTILSALRRLILLPRMCAVALEQL